MSETLDQPGFGWSIYFLDHVGSGPRYVERYVQAQSDASHKSTVSSGAPQRPHTQQALCSAGEDSQSKQDTIT